MGVVSGHTFAKKYSLISKLFSFLFHDKSVPETLVNGSCFLQLILEINAQTPLVLFFNMTVLSLFIAILYFHSLYDVCPEVGSQKYHNAQDYKARPLIEHCI